MNDSKILIETLREVLDEEATRVDVEETDEVIIHE